MPQQIDSKNYQRLISNIGKTYEGAKQNVVARVNQEMLHGYWQIGKYIVEFEQQGEQKAEYGKRLIVQLSKDLSQQYGRGFSRTNLQNMRLLYQYYPICQTLSGELTWSHYIELLSIDDELARSFYEKQATLDNWSIRELKRQKKTALFHRLAVSKDRAEIIALSQQGHIAKPEADFIRNPHVFEFMDLPEKALYSESDIETALINNLHDFLLELGNGFAFVGRQQRITLNNRHYFVDLVFYHVKLKCYVLIDLKLGKVDHEHIGQMKLYLGYYAHEISEESDNPPIGIILSEENDDIMVEYAMLNDESKLVVSKYQVHLPDTELLRARVREIIYRE